MFATVAGISQRAPVHWSENVIGAAICFPYVLALDDEFITVHSMLDQQQKQTLPFKEGHILQDFEGTVYIEILTKCSYRLSYNMSSVNAVKGPSGTRLDAEHSRYADGGNTLCTSGPPGPVGRGTFEQ